MRSFWGIMLLSVSVCVSLSGCSGGSDGETRTFDPKKDTSHDAEHGHVHGHEHGHGHGPNGGDLIELGEEEFHAEALFDEDHHKVVLFILDGEAKKAVPIEAKEIVVELPGKDAAVTYTLAAVPQEGDAERTSSRFELASEALIEAFHDAPKTVGKFKVTINGKEFTGDLKHDHDDHGHEHKHDEKK